MIQAHLPAYGYAQHQYDSPVPLLPPVTSAQVALYFFLRSCDRHIVARSSCGSRYSDSTKAEAYRDSLPNNGTKQLNMLSLRRACAEIEGNGYQRRTW